MGIEGGDRGKEERTEGGRSKEEGRRKGGRTFCCVSIYMCMCHIVSHVYMYMYIPLWV